MRLLVVFARAYRARTAIMLGCLLLAALAEGVGLSSLLPLLGLVTQTAAGPGATPAASNDSSLARMVQSGLERVGIEPSIGPLLLLIVGGIAMKAALVLLAQKQIGYTVAHVATDLRLALLRSLFGARWEHYIRRPVGSMANSFATEASRASDAYLHGATLSALGIQTVVYGIIASLVSWQATVGAATVGLTILILLNGLVRMTRRAGIRQTELLRSLLGRMTDVFYAVKPLKAMARETLVGPLLRRETEQLNRALERQVLSRESLRALQEPLLVGALAGGLYLAVAKWSLALDNVMLLALLFGKALISLNKVQKKYQAMMACESAYWSLREGIEKSDAVRERSDGRRSPLLEHAIQLRNVSLSYGTRPVLNNVSLEIPAGQLTAIVGPSGAGKTSVADVMIGLFPAQDGDVWIDDVPLSQINLRQWRRSVGYVPQETFLLHESVLTNVTLADPLLTPDDAELALRAAEAWGFVSKLPEGMETMLGERGSRLSGGQRQRIAIARALVHKPTFLILDEATAALDPESETAIYQALKALRGKMTIFAISHQPALLKSADRVYRLHNGQVNRQRPGETTEHEASATERGASLIR